MKLRLSDAEWTVMRALWKGAPANARDVLERSGETGWAYTTVKTVLDRLVEKGLVAARLRANVSFYEPRVTQVEARGAALRALVERAFDGAFGSLAQHMLDEQRLTKKDRRELRRALAALAAKGDGA